LYFIKAIYTQYSDSLFINNTGRDLEPGKEGGSWLALSSQGRIAVLLNVTGENIQDPSCNTGRGFIVADFVTNKQHETQEEYLERLSKNGHKYSPFNFISIDIR
jgi:uncharacterized protein with NRDE domain